MQNFRFLLFLYALFSVFFSRYFPLDYKLAKTSSPVISLERSKRERRFLGNGYQFTLLFFFSFSRTRGRLRSCGRVRPRCASPTISCCEIFFFDVGITATAHVTRFIAIQKRAEVSSSLEENPPLFQRFWPGVMCRSGFSCIVCPSFVMMREKKFPASRIAIS